MSTSLVISVLIGYFSLLILIAFLTSRGATNDSFFTGERKSPWYLVAFGMIGASLSGVTFISVPGAVINNGMIYFQVVLGYVLGYLVIAKVLMPLYYRMNLISIYEYLEERFGVVSYKTGAAIFIVSRTLGSAMRLYLATIVLQLFLFDELGIPYWLTAIITVLLIWVYTFKGGIKTIVYTDTFQTFFLVSAVIICAVIIAEKLDISFWSLFDEVGEIKSKSGESINQLFQWSDWKASSYFPKQFFGGMFLAIAMTGLDQDLMQKNLTCKNLQDAQKNMYSFTTILVAVNFLFLLLGGALYLYAEKMGVNLPTNANGELITDQVFPTLALSEFGTVAGIFFLLGITASSYASSDSALAALTTGFCIDFLNFKKRTNEAEKTRLKLYTHIGFSLLFLVIVLLVYAIKSQDLISMVLKVAAYTYGPLLGLFFFGLLTKRTVKDQWVPIICILAPVISYGIDYYSPSLLNGYAFGFELLAINGLITAFGLYLISTQQEQKQQTL